MALADKSGIDTHITIFAPFKAHGGKLLLYHGWADQAIPPGNTVNFYSAVLQTMGPDQSDWLRLFMIPGMQHCAGGQGTISSIKWRSSSAGAKTARRPIGLSRRT